MKADQPRCVDWPDDEFACANVVGALHCRTRRDYHMAGKTGKKTARRSPAKKTARRTAK